MTGLAEVLQPIVRSPSSASLGIDLGCNTSDLCGPFDLSMGGFRHFVTWIDFKTRYVNIEFLKNKECRTVTESFKRYLMWISRQKNTQVKRIRTDNGGEYTGQEFENLCGELGIIHETTSPYTPEHNGVAERYNPMIQEGALTLLHDSGLSFKFWVSAVHTVNFVKNHLFHARIEKSPYESFWGRKPRVDWLRTFGVKCWVLVPKSIRKKGNFRSVEGIFVGYFDNSKAYKIWFPRSWTILKSRDVIFDESNHIERVTIHSTDDDDLPNLWEKDILTHFTPIPLPSLLTPLTEDNKLPFAPEYGEPEREVETEEGDKEAEQRGTVDEHQEAEENHVYAPKDFERGAWLDPSNITYGRGKRVKALYSELTALTEGTMALEHTEQIFVTLADDEPSNFKEAMNSPTADEWQKACQAEIENLSSYDTWRLVDRPTDTNIVGNRWVFRVKRDNLG